MDAWNADRRLVEIWEMNHAAAGHRLRDNLRLHLSDRTEGRGLGRRYLSASPQTPSPGRRARASRDTIKDPDRRSMIVRRPLKAAARPAIGRATSSSANAHGLCSSCMSESRGSALAARGSRGKPAAETISAMLAVFRSHRSSTAKINHLRQRHRLRPATACSGPCAT